MQSTNTEIDEFVRSSNYKENRSTLLFNNT